MMNRFPKVLLTLLLTLLLALSLSGCDLMVGTGPEAPIPPGVEQTGDRIPPYAGGTREYEYAGDARRPQEPGTDDSSTGGRTATRRTRCRTASPKPVEPETSQPDTSHQDTCTISISCATIWIIWTSARSPSGGWCPPTGDPACRYGDVFPGESVFDVLQRVCKERKDPHGVQLHAHLQLRLYRGSITCMSST